MMDDTKFGPGYGGGSGSGFASGYAPASGPAASVPEPPVDDAVESAADPAATENTVEQQGLDPAVEKFQSCRWRATPDAGDFCTHRDVLPFAGKEGFKPESWCPECAFYKLRRTPKKRDRNDYMY
jgi:hypothetical protein